MNRLGGKSNTGEGGEDEMRYEPFAKWRFNAQLRLNKLLLQVLV